MTADRAPAGLPEAVDAIAAGRLAEAGAYFASVDDPGLELCDLLLALDHGQKSTGEIRDRWDALATCEGARTIRSTWSVPGPDLRTEGDGRAGLDPPGIALTALGDERVSVRMPFEDLDGTVVAHVALQLQSNVGDDFYLVLRSEEGNESLRCSRSGITVVGSGRTHYCDLSRTTLVTMASTPDRLTIHVNGTPAIRMRRARPGPVSALSFDLAGNGSADLGAWIPGAVVWSGSNEAGWAAVAGERWLRAKVQQLARANDAGGIARLTDVIDDLRADELGLDAEKLATDLIDAKPYWPDVVEGLLEQLPDERRTHWRQVNAHRLPTPLVSVNDITVRLSANPQLLVSLTRVLRRRSAGMFDVLRDVGFDVFPGDVLGVIGENGAGKSTLLRTISGLIPLSRGSIEVRGKTTLLRAGIGFREEATGRQNIRLASAYLGLESRSLAEVELEVEAFSELGEAMDRPLKTYSDGMRGRLVFALATSIRPEILLLDEPLSAGDARFRDRAAARMDALMGRARAVVIVTHGTDFVRQHCTKALYLAAGEVRHFGDPHVTVERYLDDLHLSKPGSFA